MPVTFTTDLPDVESMVLDASEAETLGVEWGDVLNNGEYRLELRDDDPDGNHPDYQHEVTVGHTTVMHTIQNILGGEQYSVRIRSQTAHKTGAWLSAEEISKLLASDDLSLSNVTATSVNLDWTINNDFRGSHQILRRRSDYEYNTDEWRLVESVADDVSGGTDENAQPDREYAYKIRTLTQWQYADSPGTVTTETDGIGLEDRAVPPRGWYAEIDHPSGTILTPQILDDPVRRPTVNGFPRVELPVPQDETWHATAFDDALLSVWHDGDREPIEQLEHRRLRPDRTVLEGRGGTQLDRRVIEAVDVQPTHEFVRYLLEEYTDYVANVDDPDTDQEERVLQAAETDVELQQALAEIPSDSPLYFASGGLLDVYQTCHFREGENYDSATGTSTVSDSEASDGSTQQLASTGDILTFTFETGYDISSALVHFRRRPVVDSNNGAFEIRVDGTVLFSGGEDGMTAGYGWQDFDAGSLSAGTHTLEIELTSSGTDKEINVDAVALEDSAYNHAFDNTVDTNGYLDGPRLFPHEERVALTEIQTPLGIAEATLSTDSTVAELALRTDGTGSYDAADDTASHTVTYSELSTSAQGRVALGYDPSVTRDTASPRTGYQSYTLDSLELTAVLDDTPVLTNRSFDGKLIDVLREVADIGNFVFEVQADGDQTTVEWTQLGQRQATVGPDLADYSIDRQTEDVVERAIVYGGAARVTRQTVDVTIGEWVDLPFPDSKIVDGKETLYENDTEFERGTDYEIRYATADGQPRIKALSGGALSDGQTVSVDADVKPRGSYTEGGAGQNPKTIIEDVPGLASKQMCDQVALYAVEETGDAIVDASVTIPTESVGWSLVDAIDIDRLPGDDSWEVDDISYGDGEVSVELGNGPSADDFLEEVDSRTKRNSERV